MGELPAGTPLRLDELARSLGMSISPIREAVRQLEALGLAKHVPHQGARVLEFDVDELRDLFEVRLALESLAVRRAAERFTDEDATAARGHLARLDEPRGEGDVRATMRAHTDFHFTLYEASRSPWLVALIRPAWDRSERYRPALSRGRGELQERHRELDGRLLEACAAHDPAAARGALRASRAREPLLRDRARRQGHLRARRVNQSRNAVPPHPGSGLDAPAAEVLRDGDDEVVLAGEERQVQGVVAADAAQEPVVARAIGVVAAKERRAVQKRTARSLKPSWSGASGPARSGRARARRCWPLADGFRRDRSVRPDGSLEQRPRLCRERLPARRLLRRSRITIPADETRSVARTPAAAPEKRGRAVSEASEVQAGAPDQHADPARLRRGQPRRSRVGDVSPSHACTGECDPKREPRVDRERGRRPEALAVVELPREIPLKTGVYWIASGLPTWCGRTKNDS